MGSLETFVSLDKVVKTSVTNHDASMQMHRYENHSNPVSGRESKNEFNHSQFFSMVASEISSMRNKIFKICY